MDLLDLCTLFGIMLFMAAVPSTSVVVVVTRTVAFGFRHGVAATAGIISGDSVFALLAIGGLTAIAEALGNHFVYVKYLGGVYLIWFGLTLLWSRPTSRKKPPATRSPFSSYMVGLLLTLGDLKAVFFYASLFPSFVDVEVLSFPEVVVIVLATVISVGAVKLGYAYLAHNGRHSVSDGRSGGAFVSAAGTVSVGAGVLVLTKA